jgi:putative PIN family toxin of toxin-antitoxin system
VLGSPRVVLDTNVYVSAYGYGGLPLRLLILGLEGRYQLVTSPALLAETAGALARVLDMDATGVERALRQIVRNSEIIVPDARLSVIADEPDNRVVECAVEGRADAIGSGDNDLLTVGSYGPVRMMRVAEFLESLGEG